MKQKRILLIDDNADAVSMLQLLLDTLGYSVETANSGEEGIWIAQAFLPHVVFLDLGMPKMSGYDVARALRQIDTLRDVYLLALTGWQDDKTRAAVVEAGFDRHLVKPADGAHIMQLLDEFFTSHDEQTLPEMHG